MVPQSRALNFIISVELGNVLYFLLICFNSITDQVRQKFKTLKSYFMKEHRKVQNAPSGSEGKVEVKWELYPHLLFLSDTCTFSSQASWSMPSQVSNNY